MLDLHTHSTASDGSYSPAALVNLASKITLSAMAITDHDCIDGIDEALEAAKDKKLKIICGIELSAQIAKGCLHIVGLFIDHRHPVLIKSLKQIIEMRQERNPKIADRLAQLRIPVSLCEAQKVAGGKVVGRPHFAQVMIEKGFVKSTNEAFKKYLGADGLAFFSRQRLSAEKCITIIRQSGGVPVLAHPAQTKLQGQEFEKLVAQLADFGLAGIEVFCPPHTSTQIHKYSAIAGKYNLVRSGGSDFHGKSKPDIRLGRGFGSLYVPDNLLPAIEERSQKIRSKVCENTSN